ncbi:MAG: glycoside hydrolase family 3 C-terminal domain-containing protein [Bacilli bacterium]|nr:glycoside hydrolase family 3 C-terminal domain-containing protein [Bacilli bacterium]
MDKKYILEHLTLFDKASLLVGYANMCTRPIEAFDIPSFTMSDGPNGVRKEGASDGFNGTVKTLPATCFPCGSAIAASWDNELFYKVGKQIALECRYYDVNALLGPGINIKRNPLCGRNFEYLSEDPLLAGYLASNYINGVQSEKVLACMKHYACNNLEKWRYVGNSVVDLRALNEIYLKPFEIAIRESNPGMVMTSYNQINGTFASENVYLLMDRLRKKFNYQGLTVTDWGGMVNRDISLNAGQDLEMPGGVKENIKKIVDGVHDKMILEKTVDESVTRLLEAIEKTRVTDKPSKEVFRESKKVALEAAIKSAVLLKNNDDLLPLHKDKRYCVIGDLFANITFQGNGSALIAANDLVDNITAFNNFGVQYDFARGYTVGSQILNLIQEQEAINLARESDVIIFFGGLSDLAESEGFDRDNMKLEESQIHLLEKLVELKKKIVFVMYGGAPFEIPCKENIDAMLYMNLPGQYGGEALVKLLFGEVSPSGHLAFSWPEKYEDVPFGEEYAVTPIELYKESIYVGYRYYSSAKKYVSFPFGYGLTYGKYHFEDLKVKVNEEDIDVSFAAVNDSNRNVDAVAQIYVGKVDSKIYRPIKELKTYARIALNKKNKQIIKLKIKIADLLVYDRKTGEDVLEDGDYVIYLSEHVNKDVESVTISLKGKKLSSSKEEEKYFHPEHLRDLEKSDFEKLIGYEVEEYKPAKKPYTLETPICEFKSFFGKIAKNKMLDVGNKIIKDAKKIKDEKERQRQIKTGYFLKRMVLVNCLRSLSFSSSGVLPYKKAKGILDLANGRVFRGLSKLIR